MALALEQKRQLPYAVAELEKATNLSGCGTFDRALLAHAHALAGEKGRALSVLHELKAQSRQKVRLSARPRAHPYRAWRPKLRVEWLEKAYRERTMRIQELPQPSSTACVPTCASEISFDASASRFRDTAFASMLVVCLKVAI
jgi:hypothetical protein